MDASISSKPWEFKDKKKKEKKKSRTKAIVFSPVSISMKKISFFFFLLTQYTWITCMRRNLVRC